MSTLVEDIVIQQGATYRRIYAVTNAPGSIAGYTAKMQVRLSKSSEDVLVDVTAVVDGINNQVVVTITDDATRVMNWLYGRYDVELVNPSAGVNDIKTWRIAEGAARFSKEVTR